MRRNEDEKEAPPGSADAQPPAARSSHRSSSHRSKLQRSGLEELRANVSRFFSEKEPSDALNRGRESPHTLSFSRVFANRSRLAQDPLLYDELVTVAGSFVSNIRLFLSLSYASSFGDYLLDLSICATHACADLVKRNCFEWGLSQWLQFSERPSSSCGDLFNILLKIL